MASAEVLEETIKDFVESRTGETVYLDLSRENDVILRPLCIKGSVSLGAFWVKVLQHSNNYPVYAYPYKKLYQTGHKFQLQLRIDGLSITIDLISGQMIIRGQHVIDWFITKFPQLMDGYSKPVTTAAQKLCQHYTEEEILRLKDVKEKTYKSYIEKWPQNVLEKAVNVMDAGREDKTYYESISLDGYLDGHDLETYCPIAGLLDDIDTKNQLERLSNGRVIQGSVLYRLWKSTLQMWFSNKDAKVFIVTPVIDADRLSDICTFFLQNRLTACIDTICIPLGTLYNFSKVRRTAILRFSARDQVVIEYKIFNNVVYPLKDFTTSFIAMVTEGVASILQTNTNFDRSNFITSKCTTAEYLKLDVPIFYQSHLDPILL